MAWRTVPGSLLIIARIRLDFSRRASLAETRHASRLFGMLADLLFNLIRNFRMLLQKLFCVLAALPKFRVAVGKERAVRARR